jgi:hypothetical protein
MRLDTASHPIMLAEPSFNSKEAREKAVELLFEKYQAPGKQLGLGLESGFCALIAVVLSWLTSVLFGRRDCGRLRGALYCTAYPTL